EPRSRGLSLAPPASVQPSSSRDRIEARSAVPGMSSSSVRSWAVGARADLDGFEHRAAPAVGRQEHGLVLEPAVAALDLDRGAGFVVVRLGPARAAPGGALERVARAGRADLETDGGAVGRLGPPREAPRTPAGRQLERTRQILLPQLPVVDV